MVLGGVFERNPGLQIVCAEGDAGWVPHYLYRMDHAFERHRHWLSAGQALTQRPSEYFLNHVYLTFEDDWPALRQIDAMNPQRLLWANDFPHADSTWPHTQEKIAAQIAGLSDDEVAAVTWRNASELFDHSVPDTVQRDPNAY